MNPDGRESINICKFDNVLGMSLTPSGYSTI